MQAKKRKRTDSLTQVVRMKNCVSNINIHKEKEQELDSV